MEDAGRCGRGGGVGERGGGGGRLARAVASLTVVSGDIVALLAAIVGVVGLLTSFSPLPSSPQSHPLFLVPPHQA